ncbi:DUF2523 family protein [Pseudomonas aeruginosa]|uniref:DUF2523 family protein n=1 Tax=Pseudomonas aeruginosa TaxID=287 RepID=UPI001C98C757|nr:DUF2523 family protein [Pseudomonas aeruginosa]WGT18091.1 DUF2523 family protein [Pseudomonas aeruginosa]
MASNIPLIAVLSCRFLSSGSLSAAFSNLGGVPAQWLQVLGLLQVDVCINILFSAYIARAVLWGMDKSGGKSGMRWTGPK